MKTLLVVAQLPVLGMLWKWTVLLALGWTAHGLLRARDARWRLILWRGVLCAGLALPLMQFLPMPAYHLPIHNITQAAPATPDMAAVEMSGNTIPPVRAEAAPATTPKVAGSSAAIGHSYHPANRQFPTISLGSLLMLIWVVGAFGAMLRLGCLMAQLHALKRTAAPAVPGIQSLARETLMRLQVRRAVRVLVSGTAVSPFVFGVVHPVLMLPAKLAQDRSSEELAALLAHEMAHLRGHDLLWCVGWRWVQALFWFHPLVWKVPAAHSLACEEEADRVASSRMESRATYARLLAQITLRVLNIPEVETHFAANGAAQITHRLSRLDKQFGTWKPRHSLGAFGLLVAMALIAGGCNVSSEKNTQDVEQLKARVAELEQQMGEMQAQLQPQMRQRAYRVKFDQRLDLDRKKYSPEQLQEADYMYIAGATNNPGSPEFIDRLKQMLEKYPDVNRSGCALCDIAVTRTNWPDAEKYLKECIDKYDDCYYGDGVQIGAFARFILAGAYRQNGENDKAAALDQEIKDKYSDAIDHNGQLLINQIPWVKVHSVIETHTFGEPKRPVAGV